MNIESTPNFSGRLQYNNNTNNIHSNYISIDKLEIAFRSASTQPDFDATKFLETFIEDSATPLLEKSIENITTQTPPDEIAKETSNLLTDIEEYATDLAKRFISKLPAGTPLEVTILNDTITLDLTNPKSAIRTIQSGTGKMIVTDVKSTITNNIATIQEKIEQRKKLTPADLKLVAQNEALLKALPELQSVFDQHNVAINFQDQNGNEISFTDLINQLQTAEKEIVTQVEETLTNTIVEELSTLESFNSEINLFYDTVHPKISNDPKIANIEKTVALLKSLISSTFPTNNELIERVISAIITIENSSIDQPKLTRLKEQIISSLENTAEAAKLKEIAGLKQYLIESMPNKTTPAGLQNTQEEILDILKKVSLDLNRIEKTVPLQTINQSLIFTTLAKYSPALSKVFQSISESISTIIIPNKSSGYKYPPKQETIKPETLPPQEKYNKSTFGNKDNNILPGYTNPEKENITTQKAVIIENLKILEELFLNPAEMVKYNYTPDEVVSIVTNLVSNLTSIVKIPNLPPDKETEITEKIATLNTLINHITKDIEKILKTPPAYISEILSLSNTPTQTPPPPDDDITKMAINNSSGIATFLQAFIAELEKFFKLRSEPRNNPAPYEKPSRKRKPPVKRVFFRR